MINYIRESRLRPTPEQRQAAAARIYDLLDETQRLKLFEQALGQLSGSAADPNSEWHGRLARGGGLNRTGETPVPLGNVYATRSAGFEPAVVLQHRPQQAQALRYSNS